MNSYVWKYVAYFDYEYGLSPNKMNGVMYSEFHVIPSNNHTPLLHVRVHCQPVRKFFSDSGSGTRVKRTRINMR